MSDESERIAEQAAEYLVRSREETPTQREERERWLAADPRHRHVYRDLEELDARIASLRGDPELQALSACDLQKIKGARKVLH